MQGLGHFAFTPRRARAVTSCQWTTAVAAYGPCDRRHPTPVDLQPTQAKPSLWLNIPLWCPCNG